MALESRPGMWDSEHPLDIGKLDHGKMEALRKHENLLHALDSWTLIADMSHKTSLVELAKIVNALYGYHGGLTVYRGFDPKSNFQDTMGLSTKGFFSAKVSDYDKAHNFVYTNDQNPLSFSWDFQIAQAFGSTVIRTHLDPKKEEFLRYTDELAALICERRKIPPMTQKEVIVLPPYSLHCHVMEK